jgi:hypothetical protein
MISGKIKKKKKNGKRFLNVYFLRFLDLSATDPDALLAALVPAPEGGDVVLFGDGPGGPLSHRLEGLLGQGFARQLPLDGREQEKVRWSEVRQIGRIVDQPELPGSHPIFDNGGSMDWSIVPVKEPLLGCHIRSLLLESRQELAQGIHNVVRVDRLAFRNIIRIDKPIVVEKRQDSSIVTMESSIAIKRPRTIAKNFSQVLILSFLWALVNSFGTHLADFFDRSRSSCRVSWMVHMQTPWETASFRIVIRRSSSTSAAISATKSGLLTFLLPLCCLWSLVTFPSFTALMI